jgi:hypothetical protein
MIIDALLQFDAAANLALAVGTYNSTNIIDLHIVGGGLPVLGNVGARDIGIGDDPAMKVHSVVKATFTSGGAGTLVVNLQGAPDSGAGTPGTWTTFASSPTYALATLVAGARLLEIDMPRPPAGVSFPRFLRMTYVIGGATMTAGTVESELVLDRFDQPEQANAVLGGYPAGITIAN